MGEALIKARVGETVKVKSPSGDDAVQDFGDRVKKCRMQNAECRIKAFILHSSFCILHWISPR